MTPLPMTEETRIPEEFRPLFWDAAWESLDVRGHAAFIIERLLNEGDETHVRWIFRTYGARSVKAVVCESRRLSRKTARCWQSFFGLREEEMRCFGMSSTTNGNAY
jgi:hypothetical protein